MFILGGMAACPFIWISYNSSPFIKNDRLGAGPHHCSHQLDTTNLGTKPPKEATECAIAKIRQALPGEVEGGQQQQGPPAEFLDLFGLARNIPKKEDLSYKRRYMDGCLGFFLGDDILQTWHATGIQANL